MSETKFTPGPWFLEQRGADSSASPPPGFSLPGIAVFATALDGHDIRTRYSDDNFICGMWSVVSDEDRANARLIAAAPELYEALSELVTLKAMKARAMSRMRDDKTDADELAEYDRRKPLAWEAALAALSKAQPEGK